MPKLKNSSRRIELVYGMKSRCFSLVLESRASRPCSSKWGWFTTSASTLFHLTSRRVHHAYSSTHVPLEYKWCLDHTMWKRGTVTERSYTPTLSSQWGKLSCPVRLRHQLTSRVLLEGVSLMEISVSPNNQPRWDIIMSAPVQIEGDQMPPKLAEAVKELWADQGVRQAFNRRNELQLNDSAP
jgi:hypothetical protein